MLKSAAPNSRPFTARTLVVAQQQILLAELLQHHFNLVASILDNNALRLRDCPTEGNVAVILGNEDAGLDTEWLDLCSHRVTIPMHSGTDSLNVAVAAAVFMHHFAENINDTSTGIGDR